MFELAVPAQMPSMGILRGAVAGLESYYAGQDGGPTAREVYAWSLGVYEAATNIVRHAYDGGSDALVRLTIAPGEGRVLFTLRDRGRANPAWPLPTAAAPALQEGGHGLWIIRQIFEGVDYRCADGENVLHLEARFSGPAPQRDGQSDERAFRKL